MNRFSRLLVCIVLGGAILVASAAAQTGWSVVQQNATTQDLWAIAYSGSTLVAVGQSGTIITRDDVSGVWAPRSSGTTVWLVGVGFGGSRFVVVGDGGTILTSDDDGATWTPRTSGTTTRLNAVVYGGGIWIAVGEQGSVLTSTDGAVWSSHPALSTGFLRALAYGEGRFLIGGANGVLYTTIDGTTFTEVSSGTTSNIEGAAISDTHFWIVGSNGLWASATTLGTWTYGPATTTATFRGVAPRSSGEAVTVGESLAGVFRNETWSADKPVPPFLATAVTRRNDEMVTVGLAGGVARADVVPRATLTVNGGRAVEYGSDATILAAQVDFNFPPISDSLTTYQWYDHAGAAIPGATKKELDVLHITPETSQYTVNWTAANRSGSLGVTVPLYPSGQIDMRDPGFTSPLPNAPYLVVPMSDGKLLVAASFGESPGGGTINGVRRLNSDGSVDSSFHSESIPTNSTIAAIHVLADGRLYIRGSFLSVAGQARSGLARLLSDGSLDSTFQPGSSAYPWPRSAVAPDGRLYVSDGQQTWRLSMDGSVDSTFNPVTGQLLGVDATGRVLAAMKSGLSTALVRYTTNGKIDPSYTWTGGIPVPSESLWSNDPFYRAQITAQGVYATAVTYSLHGVSHYTFWKTLPDGGVDPNYHTPAPRTDVETLYSFAYTAEGGLWVASGGQLLRFAASGDPEPTQYASVPSVPDLRLLAIAADGSLFVSGNSLTDFLRIRTLAGRPSVLTNVSARAYVPSNDAPLIAGFVTSGSGATSAIVRGIGPTLGALGVSDPVSNPQIRLVRDGSEVVQNDNWVTVLAPRFSAVGAFPLPVGSADAALESTVGDGNYTAVLGLESEGSGTALAEVYQSENAFAATRHLVNISARATVDESHPLIGGFIISGDIPVKVLIRAVGPALAAPPFNLSDTLANPYLTLYRGRAVIWDNDDWDAVGISNGSVVAGAAQQVGAFPLGSGRKDAAALVTLAPGAYTAVVTSADGTSGTALVEVYAIP